jgi:hypothetical protein
VRFDWLVAEPVSRQRLADDPHDHRLKTYYHWIRRPLLHHSRQRVPDQFDADQVKWFEESSRATRKPAIRTIIVGMRPFDSIAAGYERLVAGRAERPAGLQTSSG